MSDLDLQRMDVYSFEPSIYEAGGGAEAAKRLQWG